MRIGPGGADASSAAQPAGDTWIDVQPSASSAPLLLDLPAAHYFCTSYRLDVRWQVEQSWGYWWGIPQSAAIDGVYKTTAAGVNYNYTWWGGRISYYQRAFVDTAEPDESELDESEPDDEAVWTLYQLPFGRPMAG